MEASFRLRSQIFIRATYDLICICSLVACHPFVAHRYTHTSFISNQILIYHTLYLFVFAAWCIRWTVHLPHSCTYLCSMYILYICLQLLIKLAPLSWVRHCVYAVLQKLAMQRNLYACHVFGNISFFIAYKC